MPEPPTVNVIIPAHNAAEFLPEAVESLRIQGHPGMEIILVDDSSADNTADLAAGWGSSVRYVRADCGSPAAARNLGLRLSRADFVGFLDADDLWTPDRLPAQLAFHDLHPELDYSHGYTRKVYLDSHLPSRQHIPRDDTAHLNPNSGSVLFRREALLRLGEFDETIRFGEDIDLLLRCRSAGLIGAVFERVVLHYRMHAGNMTNFQAAQHHDLLTILHKSVVRQGRRPLFSPQDARLPHFSDEKRDFPLVSVIVYGRAPGNQLEDTLQSISRQGYPNLELLVVADQPPKASNRIDRHSYELLQRSRFIRAEGREHAEALNLAWRAAKGDFLACVQAGDMWSQDRLRHQVGVLLFNPQAGLVLGEIRLVVDPFNLNPGGAPGFWPLPGDNLGAALIRREALDLVGDLDPEFREGAAAEWLSRFANGPARKRYPLIVRLPRVVQYQRLENRSHFDVGTWSRTNLIHILHRAIPRHRGQEL